MEAETPTHPPTPPPPTKKQAFPQRGTGIGNCRRSLPAIESLLPLPSRRERQGDGHMSPSCCPSASTRMYHVALHLPFPFWKERERVSQWGRTPLAVSPPCFPAWKGIEKWWAGGWAGFSSSLATRTPFVDKGCVFCFRQKKHNSVREGRTMISGHVTFPLPFGLGWGLNGACLGPIWGPLWLVWACLSLSGACLVPLVDNLGHPGGLVQHTLPHKTSPTNLSVKTGIRERLPHPRLPQQTFPNRTSPTNHTGRISPHPFHKGERGGEVVDDPCQPLTHSDPFRPEGKGKGMATCHHLAIRPFPHACIMWHSPCLSLSGSQGNE